MPFAYIINILLALCCHYLYITIVFGMHTRFSTFSRSLLALQSKCFCHIRFIGMAYDFGSKLATVA